MRTLAGSPLSQYLVAEATDPVYFVRIFWSSGTLNYISRRAVSYLPYLLKIGNVDTTLDFDGAISLSSATIDLDDSSKHFRDKLKANAISNVHAQILMTYKVAGTIDTANAVILLDGYIASQMSWSESQRILTITIESFSTDDRVIKTDFGALPIDTKYKGQDLPLSIGNTPLKDGLNMPTWATFAPVAQLGVKLRDAPSSPTTRLITIGIGSYSGSGTITVRSTKAYPQSGQFWVAAKCNYTPETELDYKFERSALANQNRYLITVTLPNPAWLTDNYTTWGTFDVRWDRSWTGSDGPVVDGASNYVFRVASYSEDAERNIAYLQLVVSASSPLLNKGAPVYIRIKSAGGALLVQNQSGIVGWNTDSLPVGSTVIPLNTSPSGFATWLTTPGLLWKRNSNETYTVTSVAIANSITISPGLVTELTYQSDVRLHPNIPSPENTKPFLVYLLVSVASATTLSVTRWSTFGVKIPENTSVVMAAPPSSVGAPYNHNNSFKNYWALYFLDRHIVDYVAGEQTLVLGVQADGDHRNYILSGFNRAYTSERYAPPTYNYHAAAIDNSIEMIAINEKLNGGDEFGVYATNKLPSVPVSTKPTNFVKMLKLFIDTYAPQLDTTDSSWASGDAYTLTEQGSFNAAGEYLGPFIMTHTGRKAIETVRQACFEQRCQIVISGTKAKILYMPRSSPTSAYTITLDMIVEGSFVLEIPDSLNLFTYFEGKAAQWAMSAVKDYFEEGLDYENTAATTLIGFKKYTPIDFMTTINSATMLSCLKYWGYKLSNAWKRIKITCFLSTLPVEIGDIVTVTLPDDMVLGTNVTSTLGRVISVNNNLADHTIDLVIETPYKVGSSTVDSLYWTGA